MKHQPREIKEQAFAQFRTLRTCPQTARQDWRLSSNFKADESTTGCIEFATSHARCRERR
jgi:hypothetical protein